MTVRPAASTALNRARRDREWAELSHDPTVDVLVIGGGVTGAGVALDAASRGLSVVLAERHDLAFGTSRWSSKLVHGGLRYLANGQVGIAYESAVERDRLMRFTAPHLVRPMAQVVPIFQWTPPADTALVRTGMTVGDALRFAAGTTGRLLPPTRRIPAEEARRLVPSLRTNGLRGAVLSWDGQLVDDARLVVALARTAAGFGARIFTRCAASAVTGRSALVSDTETGDTIRLRARTVINATGVWAADVVPDIRLRPSRGSHLILAASTLGHPRAALTVPVPGERSRFVFALPQDDGRVFVGLTDERVDGPIPEVPEASAEELSFLLRVINGALGTTVRPDDVLGSYAGLRPLLDVSDGESGSLTTADLSRRHAVRIADNGVVTVVGGKLTTYRRMAQDAVDTALSAADITTGPCRTRRLPLVGAAPRTRLDLLSANTSVPTRLVSRYGTEALRVHGLNAHTPIFDGTSITHGELLFGLTHEGALDSDDLLDRRTRVGLVAADRLRAEPAAREIVSGRGHRGGEQNSRV